MFSVNNRALRILPCAVEQLTSAFLLFPIIKWQLTMWDKQWHLLVLTWQWLPALDLIMCSCFPTVNIFGTSHFFPQFEPNSDLCLCPFFSLVLSCSNGNFWVSIPVVETLSILLVCLSGTLYVYFFKYQPLGSSSLFWKFWTSSLSSSGMPLNITCILSPNYYSRLSLPLNLYNFLNSDLDPPLPRALGLTQEPLI